ncbi:hypothetical protein [Micromonospora sonneratiae]|uniref:Integrin beta 3 n=1 Tax=Micromonospora sonneratiae TaxID=1184706 RepID=A0ABW3YMF3_9ACTN
MRERRRVRVAVLVAISLLLLAALPLYFGVRAAMRDPVFNALDELQVPTWAATETVDDVSGSRWCLMECRYRERTVESERGTAETAKVYEQALAGDGWQSWKVDRCPDQPVKVENIGHYSCWKRDEFTLDLWVRDATCVVEPSPEESLGPDAPGTEAPEVPGAAEPKCTGSVVSLKVRNAIADDRIGPQPTTDPSLTGVDPDPIFSNDPLLDLTPSPS